MQALVFMLTFFSYTCYHMTRKAFSAVDVSILQYNIIVLSVMVLLFRSLRCWEIALLKIRQMKLLSIVIPTTLAGPHSVSSVSPTHSLIHCSILTLLVSFRHI